MDTDTGTDYLYIIMYVYYVYTFNCSFNDIRWLIQRGGELSRPRGQTPPSELQISDVKVFLFTLVMHTLSRI